MAVQVDILEGVAASHDILAGWEITRVAVIESGLQSIATVTANGSTQSASPTVTVNTTGLLIGMSVVGTGIPVPAKVITIGSGSITLSVPATASGTPTIVFGSTDTAGLLQAAEGAVIAVVGDRGSVYPNMGAPTYLKSFEPSLIGTDGAWVKIKYKGYPLPTYEFDGSLNQVESNKDSGGTLVTVSYTYTANYPYNQVLRGQTVIQGGMISRSIPETTVTVRWIVTAGTIDASPKTATEMMAYFKTTYEGTVNNASYTVGAITGAAHTWLIEKVHGVSRDNGLTYEAAMTFHYKPNTWDQLVVFIDPITGKPPPDLVLNTGYKMVHAFPEAAFPTFTFTQN